MPLNTITLDFFCSLSFLPPNFELLQEIRNQGEIVINCRNSNNFQQNPNSNGINMAQASASSLHRQTSRVSSSPNNGGDPLLWDSTTDASNSAATNSSHVTSAKTYASIVKPAVTISGQCIAGSNCHVSVKPALAPSKYS